MRSVALAALASLPSCAGSDRPADVDWLVRDSAGVLLVENEVPAWRSGEGWSLDEQPVAVLGSDEPDATPLVRVRNAMWLSDGRIIVADGGSNQLRVFDSEREVGVWGREGSGPGDFRRLGWVGAYRGDSVAAYDLELERVSVFDRFGRLARVASLRRLDAAMPITVTAALADGSFLGWDRREYTPADSDGVYRDTVRILRHDATGAVAGSLGAFPGSETFVMRVGSGLFQSPRPFGSRSWIASGGQHVLVGTGDLFEIRVLGLDGNLRRVVRRRYARPALSREDVHAYRNARRAAVRNHVLESVVEQFLQRVPMPANLPAHGKILADPEGNLWVAAIDRPSATRSEYSILASDGRFLGTVTAPRVLELEAVRDTLVLARFQDSLGADRIAIYRLHRP